MFKSDVSKKGRRETTKGWKTFARVISGLVLVISVLMLFSVVQSVDAAAPGQVDKSGLDILCSELGGEYHFVPESNVSVCIFPDGTIMACNITSGACSSTLTISPDKYAVNNLVILKAMQAIDTKLNNLTGPDLVPLITPASILPEGFCRRNDQGQLLVNVHNQGAADAVASKTRIIFGSADPVDFDTPAIANGTGTELVIYIPNDCFDPNTQKCSFTIGVDANNTVSESSETNNNAAGLCGPQFN